MRRSLGWLKGGPSTRCEGAAGTRLPRGTVRFSTTDQRRSFTLSMQLEFVFVRDLQRRVLILAAQHRVTDNKEVKFRTHEAAKCVLGRADNRLATNVEASVDYRSGGWSWSVRCSS
jgi:hypothetical protein